MYHVVNNVLGVNVVIHATPLRFINCLGVADRHLSLFLCAHYDITPIADPGVELINSGLSGVPSQWDAWNRALLTSSSVYTYEAPHTHKEKERRSRAEKGILS